ncbi:phage portal protein, HK97 family [Devosia crocina]|uniref:Phage portal protein, HK97 family n=1 Tax=Devosia crocina TaxID=429728 RepID=A0A1I7NEV8_9HYPH|nr:phage portal protein [Devosia crocina]SFV33201.1 phage portal protein, HK97 family [Devosia crocina]
MNWLQKTIAPFLGIESKAAAPVERIEPLSVVNTQNWAYERTWSGERMATPDVLAIAAAWACVNLIAGTIGTLPLMVYRTKADGSRDLARDHRLWRVLHDSPNADQTAVDFLEFISANLELQGNGIARKNRNTQREIVGLTPARADIVAVKRKANGELRYSWSENGVSYDLPQDEVLHIRGFGGGPEGGLSTLTYGRHAFGLAQAQDRTAGGMFANGLRPSVVLSFKEFLTKEQYEQVEARLQQKFLGAMNAGRPFIAEGGQEVKTLSLTPEDAQMLESRAFSVNQVCMMFGVPPHMIGHTEKATSWGTGLEQQTLGFQKFTLRRRLGRIEKAMQKQLLTPQDRVEGITIEFSLEGLLRGDSKARAEFYARMTQMGAMTINEVRQLENLPPIDGGDVPRMQMQNVPITEAGKEENSDVPAQG